MKKIVKIYQDKKQFLIAGDLNMELNNHGTPEVYEVEMKDEDFAKLMENPDKLKINKILNKKRIT